MVTEEQIRNSLNEIIVPGVMRSIPKLNLIRKINMDDGNITITLASAALNDTAQSWIKKKALQNLRTLPDIKNVNIDFVQAHPKDISQIVGSGEFMDSKNEEEPGILCDL